MKYLPRFALRDLLWLALVLALLFAWLSEHRSRSDAQSRLEVATRDLDRESRRSAALEQANKTLMEVMQRVRAGFRPPG